MATLKGWLKAQAAADEPVPHILFEGRGDGNKRVVLGSKLMGGIYPLIVRETMNSQSASTSIFLRRDQAVGLALAILEQEGKLVGNRIEPSTQEPLLEADHRVVVQGARKGVSVALVLRDDGTVTWDQADASENQMIETPEPQPETD